LSKKIKVSENSENRYKRILMEAQGTGISRMKGGFEPTSKKEGKGRFQEEKRGTALHL